MIISSSNSESAIILFNLSIVKLVFLTFVSVTVVLAINLNKSMSYWLKVSTKLKVMIVLNSSCSAYLLRIYMIYVIKSIYVNVEYLPCFPKGAILTSISSPTK